MENTGRCTFEIRESVGKNSGKPYKHIVFKFGDYELDRASNGYPFILTKEQMYIIQTQSKKAQ